MARSVDVQSAQALAAAREAQALARGAAAEPDRLPKDAIRIVNDPLAMMQEMAEELGFLKAEELAGSQELESDEEESFRDLIDELIRESLQAQSD
ncbi:MAG: hypothetical protein EBR46_05945, partial [Betaproteobacteria bacterium]|nr:hypothetical protein [Betaproteobacteria bacterium]